MSGVEQLVRIVRWEGLLILLLLAGTLMYKALGHRAWWGGLLQVEELQLLAVTMAVSTRLAVGMVIGRGGAMPAIGLGWVLMFGASGVVYGALKGSQVLQKR